MPFPPRVRARSFLGVNPLGTIPALIDGDVFMTESSAMCQYLAVRYGPTPLDVTPEEPDYGAFLNFLHHGEATLTFPQTLVLRYSRFEPEERRQPQVADDYAKWFLARLRLLELRLQDREWVCVGRFTAADISVGYALQLAAGMVGLGRELPPILQDYLRRLSAHEAFQRAVRAENEAPQQVEVAR